MKARQELTVKGNYYDKNEVDELLISLRIALNYCPVLDKETVTTEELINTNFIIKQVREMMN